MPPIDGTGPRRVVIVGGGPAGLEAALALHDLAGPLLRVTLIAPEPEFTLGPPGVVRLFSRAKPGGLDLERLMDEHGGRFRRTATLSIDAEARTVRCATGPDEAYDALIIAVGASAHAAFLHALTFGADSLALNGFPADLEQGRSHSAAFVVPMGCSWPLPLYELALMTAEEVGGSGMEDIRLHLVTPEQTPLDIFGPAAGFAVVELLKAAHITLHSGVRAQVDRRGHIDTGRAGGLHADHVIALPVLEGPRLEGLPCDAHGFVPVDDHGRVTGARDIYAAGDATNGLVKQGGLACQQADAVAAHVASVAGAPVDPLPYVPALRARLLTGYGDRFRRRAGGGDDFAAKPLWWPPTRGTGRYLAPYLEARGLLDVPEREESSGSGMDVALPLS
jgi:sulfide:quinone oxidoreductase